MAERLPHLDDAALGEALRAIRMDLAVPTTRDATARDAAARREPLGHATARSEPLGAPEGHDLAARVRARIVAERAAIDDGQHAKTPAVGQWRDSLRQRFPGFGPVRRGLVLAAILLLAIAATAGAVGLGLPGIRIFLGPVPTATPSPPATTPLPGPTSVPGAALGLGTLLTPADVDRLLTPANLGFTVLHPNDERIGPPAASYLAEGRVTMTWATSNALPAIEVPGVGLILSQFRGTVDPGFFGKVAGPGTTIERVEVGDAPGYWISGEMHFFFYEDPSGRIVEESRRVVGDTLIWTAGEVTYRLESATGFDRAIEIAAGLR